jgi:hypothetical protein
MNHLQSYGARKWYAPLLKIAFTFCFIALLSSPITTLAAPQYGFGQGQGRTDTINENDFHTAEWARFWFNYFFSSGMDYRYDLGRPTTFSGFVPVDVYSVNIRRDANTSFLPPQYGISSGFIPTNPSNILFPPVPNLAYFTAWLLENPDMIPLFDTLFMGVNAPPLDNPMNMQNVGGGNFLPPTSI